MTFDSERAASESPPCLKDAIRRRAHELGFEACRFSQAKPPGSVHHFVGWLKDGCHGEMLYLARNQDRRTEPRRILQQAWTMVSLAAAYPATPRTAPSSAPGAARSPTGRVARYAQAADYHAVLSEPLRQLNDFIERAGPAGTRAVWYTDTGPILERAFGQQAGVGFVGKHTNLISRRLGNWFFLAEILTTLQIEPDRPEPNRCGSCVRCLDACPTRAITAPFRLDARLCISYLTIELKGSIPEPLRPALGDRIFGCDDCLDVCPWNRFAREGELMAAAVRPDLQTPRLLDWLALDDDGFRRRFRETPLWRGKRPRLLRNVCVALGNVGGSEALPALERACLAPDPLIAEHARWAVERIESRGGTAPGPLSG